MPANTKIYNMKKSKNVLLLILLFITAAASAQQSETRNIPAFNKLTIGGSFETVLSKGNETSVKITAENIEIKKVLTETNGNTLKVSLEKKSILNLNVT